MRVDPLSLWHRASREPPELLAPEARSLREGLARVRRYRSVHTQRGALPPFERDALRQGDLCALGFAPEPLAARLSHDERTTLRALLDELYQRADAPDEPWIERQALFSLGYVRDRDESGFWASILARSGAGDRFASERRTYALAALAWRAAADPDGPSERALCDATAHPRADVRASAAVYLLAAHRLSRRAAPMRTVSALHRLAHGDLALEPRAVARVLLEVDRIEVAWDPDETVYALGFSRVDEPRGSLGVAPLRAVQTLAHVDSVVRALRGDDREERSESGVGFVVALAGSVRGSRFELCASEGLGRRPGDVALGAIGLRVGDQLRHVAGSRETALTVRSIESIALSERLPWRGLHAPIALLDTQVNGTRFHRAREAIEYLCAGDEARLAREASNAHDDRAVEVFTARGDKLGYVPRGRNRVLAGVMDAGERAFARVLSAELEGDMPVIWVRVALEVDRAARRG
jgi:hypothetical protein